MSATLLPDFSINLNQRRWSCVLKSNLALSDYGLHPGQTIRTISRIMDSARILALIDNSDVFRSLRTWLKASPEKGNCPPFSPQNSAQTRRTLREWERL